MQKPFVSTVLALSIVAAFSSAAQATTYSRSQSFSSIRASHAEVFAVMERVRAFVHQSNTEIDPDYEEELLLLSGGSLELKLDRGFSKADFSGAPRPTTRVWYNYRNRSSPISHVDINLNDFSRQVKVEGTSREQVDALLGLITNDLRHIESGFGGSRDRILGGVVLLILGVLLVGLGSIVPPLTSLTWLPFVLGFSLQLSIWILPWEAWFPGTLVLPENTSFLERHADAISLLGVLVTMATAAISIGFSIYSKRRKRAKD